MKIVVYPHELILGGSQINAIDLAAAVSRLGHEVLVYALPGPLEDLIAAKGLRYVPAQRFRYRPAPNRIAQLAALARRERAGLVHAYEWPPCLDAFFGADLLLGVPTVCTVLSMSVMPAVPRRVPLIMGTEALADAARTTHRGPVAVMEPPIDIHADHPANDGAAFRAAHGIAPDTPLLVTVSRLAFDLKLDALVDLIDAADRLADAWPLRLLMVGEGPAGSQLRARAALVNQRHGREVVSLPGAVLDPRPAYAAADLVAGMGSSALRAMAHAKPVVVQGEQGFCAPFDADHAAWFLRHGFYGQGTGPDGGARLAGFLAGLLADPARRAALGAWSREQVVARYSLDAAAQRLLDIYERTRTGQPWLGARLAEAGRSAWLAAGIEARNHWPLRRKASPLPQPRGGEHP
jgi:glycosyltransferase involved in cell wall biosynthesis